MMITGTSGTPGRDGSTGKPHPYSYARFGDPRRTKRPTTRRKPNPMKGAFGKPKPARPV